MKIFLLQDVEKVGITGEILKVANGYADNYLLPKKLAIKITAANEAFYASRAKKGEKRKEVIASKTSMLAQKIQSMTITLKRKMHDDAKLYGSVNESEVVDLLAEQGVSISKSQVIFDKSIKSKGVHPVTIKLSSSLQPKITLKIVSETE